MASSALLFNRSFFSNSATPSDLAITTDETPTDDQVEEFYDRWEARYSGAGRAHRPLILSRGMDAKRLGLSHREMEFIESLKLAEHGERMRDESVALCSAEAAPEGPRTLILGGSQLMLQIHESVGHPNELDRVFGHEVDLAGSSFATTEKLGEYRYGSDIVNLVADSTVPGGLDTRGFDDECVASDRWHVVKDGIFNGYHTSREWANRIGEDKSRGTMRAEGFFNVPIIRITNLSLEPGTWDFDELLANTEDGAIFADSVKMWSIDQRRLNFQFTCEIGWEIKDGKLHKLLRSPTYQGSTPEFWRSCDAICNEDHWDLWGVPNCGKGNPMQTAEMSHGAAPARFRDVTFVR